MSYTPPPDLKGRKLRERYRKSRARQRARMLLGGLGLIAAAGIIFLVFIGVKSCVGKVGEFTSNLGGNRSRAETLASMTRRVTVENAPLYVAAGNEMYYSALLAEDSEESSSSTIEKLAANTLDGRKQVWERDVVLRSDLMSLCGDALVLTSEAVGDTSAYRLAAFSRTDGSEAWNLEIEEARYGDMLISEPLCIVRYLLPDGWRIAAYNANSGAKAWGLKPKLSGLSAEFKAEEMQSWFSCSLSAGKAVYSFGNVAGIVDVESGSPVLEYQAEGVILSAVLSPDGRYLHVLRQGNQQFAYALESLRIGEKSSVTQHRFRTTDVQPQVYSTLAASFLTYQEPGTEGDPPQRLLRFPLGAREADRQFILEDVQGLEVIDSPIAGQPQLIITNEGIGRDPQDMSIGIYTLPEEGDRLAELADSRGMVQSVITFKQDCLITTVGGALLSYDATNSRLTRILRMKHNNTWASLSANGDYVSVYSHSEDYSAGANGARFEIAVFE